VTPGGNPERATRQPFTTSIEDKLMKPPSSTPNATEAHHRPRVLAIDDDPDILTVLRATLDAEGYDVILAQDGLAGINAARQKHPDAILLDVLMPGMDGFDVYRHLRVITDAPIIFLTVKDAVEDIVRGLTLGANDYIVKPFERPELVSRLAMCLLRNKR
jgi:two-component system OmpR family response regulator